MNCATRTRHHSQFPPHVVLHPDDASNRVFLAIARALLSVVRLSPLALFPLYRLRS